MVYEPQGVAKLASLINLTRYLLASRKYWVTLIHDCYKWEDEHDVFEFFLNSVGVDPALFKLDYEAPRRVDFDDLIIDIDHVLAQHGKQWVFVFDQDDEIFARKDTWPTKYISALPFFFFFLWILVSSHGVVSRSIFCRLAIWSKWVGSVPYQEGEELSVSKGSSLQLVGVGIQI